MKTSSENCGNTIFSTYPASIFSQENTTINLWTKLNTITKPLQDNGDRSPYCTSDLGDSVNGVCIVIKGNNAINYQRNSFDTTFFATIIENSVTPAGVYPNDTNWHMITIVHALNPSASSAYTLYYVDGSLQYNATGQSTNTPKTPAQNANQGTFQIGSGIQAFELNSFWGTEDEISSWWRALDATEVASLWNSGQGNSLLAFVSSPPTSLTATAVSSSQINLSWTAPADTGNTPITGYKIERDDGSGFNTIVANTGTTATTYSDTGLTHSTTHTYRVSAINAIGTSSPSNTATATTFNVVPGAPTDLIATAISSSQINLIWTAPSENGGSPIIGYKIERNNSTGFYNIVNTTGTSTKYNNTGLIHSTTNTYRISAINAIGASPPSNNSTATTLNIAPTAPLGLVAAANSTTKINLSWISPSDNGGTSITGYKIERKTGTAPFSVLVANTGNNATTYLNSGLTSGMNYTYRVSAINAIGTSNPSTIVSSSTFFSSTDSRLDSSGEQRVSYFDGTRNWIFYYDGSNLLYRYSSDNGKTISNSSSTASGAIASNSYFGLYGESNKIIITWASSSSILSKAGKISGNTINWNSTVTVLSVSGANKGQNYYPSFEKLNSTHLFLGFNVVSGGKNAAKIYYTKNLGTIWTLSNTLYTTETNPAILGLAKYSSTKLLATYALYSKTEFNYTTFSTNSWSANAKTTGAGLSANSLKTNAFSITSNGTCAWVGYVASNSGGSLKTMLFCSPTNISFPVTGISSTNFQPSISDIGTEVRLIYQRGNVLYKITTQNGIWGSESVAVSNTFNPSFPHSQKIGGSSTYLPVEWREQSTSPFNIRFAIDVGLNTPTIEVVWESHEGFIGTSANLVMTDPQVSLGSSDWWWARSFVFEAVMIHDPDQAAVGAGFAKYIPLGQTTPITQGVGYSYQYGPEIQTYDFGNSQTQTGTYKVEKASNNCWNLYIPEPDFVTECPQSGNNPTLTEGGSPTYIVWANNNFNSPGDFVDIKTKKRSDGSWTSLARTNVDPRCFVGGDRIEVISPDLDHYELKFGTSASSNSCNSLMAPVLGKGCQVRMIKQDMTKTKIIIIAAFTVIFISGIMTFLPVYTTNNITINPNCSTEDQVSKLASFHVKKPVFLPQGYMFQCGQIGDHDIRLLYGPQNLPETFIKNNSPENSMRQQIFNGSLYIELVNVKGIMGNQSFTANIGDTNQRIIDTYHDIIQKNPSLHPVILQINGRTAWANEECSGCGQQIAQFPDGKIIRHSYNVPARIQFYDENDILNTFEANMKLGELKKVAESLK